MDIDASLNDRVSSSFFSRSFSSRLAENREIDVIIEDSTARDDTDRRCSCDAHVPSNFSFHVPCVYNAIDIASTLSVSDI